MRFSPTKLLQGLLYTAPVLLLTLAACGGGGGSSTPGGSLAAAYTVSGSFIGEPGDGLILRNNGGDDLVVPASATAYTFPTPVVAGTGYSVTVLTHPGSPAQRCSVSASGTMPNANVVNADVTCETAYPLYAEITNLSSTGLVLQNNGVDNLIAAASGAGSVQTFAFSTPLVDGASYVVAVLTQPRSPAQDCTSPDFFDTIAFNVTNTVHFTCADNPPAAAADRYAYVANSGNDTVSAYTIGAGGALTPIATVAAGDGPSSVAVDPAGKFAYVTNQTANTISAYSIASGVLPTPDGSLVALAQTGIATGATPVAITIHPSGKFAYVVNSQSNSLSAYSIAPDSGALAKMDANGAAADTQYTIPTGVRPISIALHPAGGYAYVANFIDHTVSVYSIDAISGALSLMDADSTIPDGQLSIATGASPYSVSVDPTGRFVYVANGADDTVSAYTISPADPDTGKLAEITGQGSPFGAGPGTGPRAVAAHPGGQFLYVANGVTGSVTPYTISNADGSLIPGATVGTDSGPISISIDSSGRYAYIANYGVAGTPGTTVSMYSIDAISGTLTPNGTAVTGFNPASVTTAR